MVWKFVPKDISALEHLGTFRNTSQTQFNFGTKLLDICFRDSLTRFNLIPDNIGTIDFWLILLGTNRCLDNLHPGIFTLGQFEMVQFVSGEFHTQQFDFGTIDFWVI